MIGHKGLIDRSLIVVDLMKAGQCFKKDFKAEERQHIIPTHDDRVILLGAWLSRVGSATNAPAHHAMDDEIRFLLYRTFVKLFWHVSDEIS